MKNHCRDIPPTIPLFPLELVLYPGMPLPLHIFEERYKKMISECLEKGLDFGIVLSQEGQLSRVGTIAKIENVLQRYQDGRMNLLCLGKGRFKIHQVLEDKPYYEATVTAYEDMPPDESALSIQNHAARKVLQEYIHLVGKENKTDLFTQECVETLSFVLAELTPLSLKTQQKILEMNSILERLTFTVTSLAATCTKLRVNAQLQTLFGKDHDFLSIFN